MMEFRTRPPVESDLPGIVELFEQSFGKPITAGHYRWKLRSRPSPVENAVIGVDADDRTVFHSAGIPCRCLIGGVERWVMIGVDVMTASPFRRRGLHTRYSNQLYESWRAAGVAAVIGFTNRLWGSTAAKVGLRPLVSLESLVLPLRPELWVARKTGLAGLSRLTVAGTIWRTLALRRPKSPVRIDEITEPTADFDRLWARVSAQIGNSLVRDRDWIAWRYLASPLIRYRVFLARRGAEPAGFVALRGCESSYATLAEIFTAPGDSEAFSALLQCAATVSLDGCAETLRALANPGSWTFNELRRNSFFRAGRGQVQYIPLDPDVPSHARDPWWFAAGDFDAV